MWAMSSEKKSPLPWYSVMGFVIAVLVLVSSAANGRFAPGAVVIGFVGLLLGLTGLVVQAIRSR